MDGHDLSKTAPSRDTVRTRDGVNLFCRTWGDPAGQPVLFAHSWAAHSDMWRYQMADLADRGYRCIAYDRRGHGRSSDPGHGYDTDSLADDMAQVIEAFDLTGAVLVGHSMAGGEIVRYLTRHGSGRVAKIVLIAPTTPCVAKRADNPHGIDPAMFEAVRATWRKDFHKWIGDNAAPFFTPETSPEAVRWMVDLTDSVSLDAAIACNREMTAADFRAEMRRIDVPTLVIHGDVDASAPLELTGRPTAALIPGARLEVYEGAPHGLFVTHMDRLNGDVAALIAA
jgi:pimeloyl-ACP methyl ester carboxylesterase